MRIQLRRGTAAQWAADNPTLAAGEVGVETDTGLLKSGDGSTRYNALGYLNVPDTVQPSDHGLQAWTYDPSFASTGQLATNGTLYLMEIPIRRSRSVQKLWWMHSTAGVTPTAGQNWAGLYSSAGALIASAAADGVVTQSNNAVSVTLGAAQALTPGFVWLGLLFNAATPPTMIRTNGSFAGTNNVGLTAATYRYAIGGTGLTALPASITPANNIVGASCWGGLS